METLYLTIGLYIKNMISIDSIVCILCRFGELHSNGTRALLYVLLRPRSKLRRHHHTGVCLCIFDGQCTRRAVIHVARTQHELNTRNITQTSHRDPPLHNPHKALFLSNFVCTVRKPPHTTNPLAFLCATHGLLAASYDRKYGWQVSIN